MNKLLKDAIADAKAVRETAMANAKLALEEAFAPKLQSMLSTKIREEMEEEDPAMEGEDMEQDTEMENRMKELAGISEEDEEMTSDEEDMGGDDMGDEEDMGDDEDMGDEDMEDMGDEEMSYDEEEPSEDDADLEEILRELEGEEDESEMEGETSMEEELDLDEIINALREEEGSDEEEMEDEEMDEDIDLNELLNSLNEEDEEEEEEKEMETEGKKNKMKMKKMEEDLNEAYGAVKFLRTKLSEVNLLNAKLLYVNKLFRNNLSEIQKIKVIENFDRARTVREAKLVYATLSESLKAAKSTSTKANQTKKSMMEGLASKATKSTKSVLTEGNDQINRFKKLAGII